MANRQIQIRIRIHYISIDNIHNICGMKVNYLHIQGFDFFQHKKFNYFNNNEKDAFFLRYVFDLCLFKVT